MSAAAAVGFAGPKQSRVVREFAASGARVAVLVSADTGLRGRLAETLRGLRWMVREASGGAELFAEMEPVAAGTVVVDSWLPDLDVLECVRELRVLYPAADVLAIDGSDLGAAPLQGAFRNEILHALRRLQQSDDAAWNLAPTEREIAAQRRPLTSGRRASAPLAGGGLMAPCPAEFGSREAAGAASIAPSSTRPRALPELLGEDPRMLEVSRRIQLVAPRTTAVLIEGPTGTGKELVARALHRLSPRAARPFIALNCAAIPEALLEAELFGHTRGAFTGATQGRTGRLEAAHGGTLFLDEIGELPLALQAKLLRFVECGELQRVGENEPVHVDVRILAATHRRLRRMAEAGTFRSDLYYRLSVFMIRTPGLAGRPADIRTLAEHALLRMARTEPAKTLSSEALARLLAHDWPGNVRELEHTLERAWILAEHQPVIGPEDIDFGSDCDADQGPVCVPDPTRDPTHDPVPDCGIAAG